MKKRLYNYSRLLILGIVLLYSENVFCVNDKPTQEDSVAFYQFWQQADLYILEQIQIKFKDNLSKEIKEKLQERLKELKIDKLYLDYSKKPKSTFIADDNNTDYLDNVYYNMEAGSLRVFIKNDLVNVKKKYRGEDVTSGSGTLDIEKSNFKKEVEKKINSYIEKNKISQSNSQSEQNGRGGNNGNNSTRTFLEVNEFNVIKKELTEKIEDLENQIKILQSKTTKISSDSQSEGKAAIGTNTKFYLLAGLLFISVVLLLFLFFIFRRNINNRFDQLNGELLALKSAFSRQLDAKDEEWRRRNNELQNSISNRLNDTKRDLDDLYQHVQQYQVQNQFRRMPDRKSVGTPLAPPPPAQNYKTYYLPSPDPQGFFWNDKKTTVPDGGTFYELKVEDDNPNIGQFSFYTKSEKNVKTALSNPDMYIKPVCRSIDGIYSGSSIEVKSPGKLQFMGEKWILANGAKVTIIVV